ncbi:MAG: hypothetical protein WDN46_23125 [Methylocella sp.]
MVVICALHLIPLLLGITLQLARALAADPLHYQRERVIRSAALVKRYLAIVFGAAIPEHRDKYRAEMFDERAGEGQVQLSVLEAKVPDLRVVDPGEFIDRGASLAIQHDHRSAQLVDDPIEIDDLRFES